MKKPAPRFRKGTPRALSSAETKVWAALRRAWFSGRYTWSIQSGRGKQARESHGHQYKHTNILLHTHTHSHMLICTLLHSHTLSHSYTVSHSITHTLSDTLSHTHLLTQLSQSHKPYFKFILSPILTYTCPHTHSHNSFSYILSHAHSLIHTDSLTHTLIHHLVLLVHIWR